MSILMARKASPGNCTVTLCHSSTKDIESYTKQADIVIVALGKPEWLKAHMIKDGAIIIDVGISRVDDSTAKRGYRLKGDVHFEGVSSKASYITPVPGGVGPMTVTALLLNTLEAAKQKGRCLMNPLQETNLKIASELDGTLLPIMEQFYTVQGEGYHQGKASYFIRTAGCNVGCHWCDIKDSWDQLNIH